MKIIKGDLIELANRGKFDYIIHGANCQCKMGAGIALALRMAFPEVYAADLATRSGDIFKLGDYTKVFVKGEVGNDFWIVNAYTQYQPGPDFHAFALESALYKLIVKEGLTDQTLVGVPWIGCGIGGAKKETVLPIFERYSKFINLTIVDKG